MQGGRKLNTVDYCLHYGNGMTSFIEFMKIWITLNLSLVAVDCSVRGIHMKHFKAPVKQYMALDEALPHQLICSIGLVIYFPDDLGRVDQDLQQQEGNLRKSRSHSFSNSLKRIFRKKKKQGPGEYPSSRESSVSRGYSDRAYSEEPQPSPHSGGRSRWRENRYSEDIARVPDSRHLLSTSVPVSAPIYDH